MKTALGFPDPNDDFYRRLHAAISVALPMRSLTAEIQKSMPVLTMPSISDEVRKSMRVPSISDEVRKSMRVPSISDEVRKSMLTMPSLSAEIRKSMPPFSPDYATRLRQTLRPLMSDDFTKQLRAAVGRSFNSEELYRGVTASLDANRAILAGLASSAGSVRPATEWFEGLEAEVAAEDAAEAPDKLGEWLLYLPTARQRRLLLLSLAALAQVVNVMDQQAGIETPANLNGIMLLLLAIAVLLSEWIGDAADPPPEDE